MAEWQGWCQVGDVEAIVPERIWASTQSSPEPTAAEVSDWIQKTSIRVSGRVAENYAVPTSLTQSEYDTWRTANPLAARLLEDVTAQIVAARILRLKFPRDNQQAHSWESLLAEAEETLAQLESGVIEGPDGGDDFTEIAGQTDVASTGDGDFEVFTLTERHW